MVPAAKGKTTLTKTPRITFVIYSLGPGGAERVLSNMANYWAARGWEVSLITFVGNHEPRFYSLDQHVDVNCLDVARSSENVLDSIFHNLVRINRLRSKLLEIRPEAVISFMSTTNVLTLLACMGSGIPVIVSDRTDIRKYSLSTVWTFLLKSSYPAARFLILQTREFAKAYSVGLQRKIRIIPNPVFRPSEDAISATGLVRKPAIISMGRLTYEKGMDILIQAFQAIKGRHPDWQLVILGEGPLRPELEALCERLGVQNDVTFVGQVNDPNIYLRQADLFVLASRYEGFPNALCEAMACGLPVIATQASAGVAEIIREGVDGLLVPSNSPEALARAMESLIRDDQKRRLLARRAGDIVERFSVEKIMGQWEAVLAEALAIDGKGAYEI